MILKISKSVPRGSILTEAVLTVVILSIGLTLIIQSMASALRAMAAAEDYSAAVMMLESQMFPYTAGLTAASTQEGKERFLQKDFTFKISSSPADGFGEDLRQLHAQISWGRQGRARTLKLSTYLWGSSDEKK